MFATSVKLTYFIMVLIANDIVVEASMNMIVKD